MDYSKKFLGKPIHELTYQDVVDYFQIDRPESNIIEYKSFVRHPNNKGNDDKKYLIILRSICAFLNSEGGLLIWRPQSVKKSKVKKKRYLQAL